MLITEPTDRGPLTDPALRPKSRIAGARAIEGPRSRDSGTFLATREKSPLER